MTHAVPELPQTPPSAVQVFGDRIGLVERYLRHLATTGVTHGLIGPREVPRLWERHILNCAVLTDVIGRGQSVGDIGSGAGLPGITLALRRPDLHVVLIEPLLRRVNWLSSVVGDLGLTSVEVRRARAEELDGDVQFPVVTARAVAPLERLASWGLPLVAEGGTMLAIKGRSARAELDALEPTLRLAGIVSDVLVVGGEVLAEPTNVVRIERGSGPLPWVHGVRSAGSDRTQRPRGRQGRSRS